MRITFETRKRNTGFYEVLRQGERQRQRQTETRDRQRQRVIDTDTWNHHSVKQIPAAAAAAVCDVALSSQSAARAQTLNIAQTLNNT